MSGYLAALRLSEDYPELLPKLSGIVREGKERWSLDDLLRLGLSREEISILESYGLLKVVTVV
jgi:hypothetical protein